MADDGDLPYDIEEFRRTPGTALGEPVTRVARLYDGIPVSQRQQIGGLAPWQARRAKELLEANIRGGVTLGTLAQTCGLSIRHFTRAFRRSTGLAPHQWLQHRRLRKAKELLEGSSSSLSRIALDCGFADQSHFTRTFSRIAGVTPRTWRRMTRE